MICLTRLKLFYYSRWLKIFQIRYHDQFGPLLRPERNNKKHFDITRISHKLHKVHVFNKEYLLFNVSFTGFYFSGAPRNSCWQMFLKMGVLKIFENFARKHLRWSLFWIKLQTFRPATLLKRDSNTVVSCEISQIFNNIFFYGTPPVAASGNWYTWQHKIFWSAFLWGGAWPTI